MKEILIVNQGHTDNIGDQLISEIMNRHLSNFFSISVAKFIPDEVASTICICDELPGYSGVDKVRSKSGLKDMIKKNHFLCLMALSIKYYTTINKNINNKYDAIIIGGGELLADYVAFTAAMQAWLLYAKKTRTKVILYGVSGLPFETRKNSILKIFMKDCEFVSVRDWDTQKHLSKNLKKEILYAPDIVFSMNYLYGDLLMHNTKMSDVFVSIYSPEELGVSQNIAEYYDRWVQMILEKISDTTKNLLIGYTTQSDYKAARKFYGYIQKKALFIDINVKICDYSDWKGYCNVVTKCRYVITGRMHAMIIALQCGCEIVPYMVKRKVQTFNSEYLEKQYDMQEVNDKVLSSIEAMVNYINM